MQGVGGQDFRENVFLTMFVWQLPCFGFSCAKTTNQHVLGPFTSLGSNPEVKRRGQPLPPPPPPPPSPNPACTLLGASLALPSRMLYVEAKTLLAYRRQRAAFDTLE